MQGKKKLFGFFFVEREFQLTEHRPLRGIARFLKACGVPGFSGTVGSEARNVF